MGRSVCKVMDTNPDRNGRGVRTRTGQNRREQEQECEYERQQSERGECCPVAGPARATSRYRGSRSISPAGHKRLPGLYLALLLLPTRS